MCPLPNSFEFTGVFIIYCYQIVVCIECKQRDNLQFHFISQAKKIFLTLSLLWPEARARAERNHRILISLHLSVVVAVRLHGENKQSQFVQVTKLKQTRQRVRRVHSPWVLDWTASGSQRCGAGVAQRLAVKSLCKVEESRAYSECENWAVIF